ncbi:N-acetyl-alpha-D-glucosaminyl L-malate synthase BshA [Candidatus Sumerlaeota bacterium]|nr:N-acetyl-alpha-D-glucosaminyl L-malate synthase BshA [Candidatus Sumerlaeota bacterium]
MRIGIVCYPTYGGSGAAATELARCLAARGHSVHLVSASRPFRMADDTFQENLTLHEIPSVDYPVLRSELYTLSTAVKLAELIEEENLDILHSHYAVPHAVSAMLARQICPRSQARLVTTLHGTDITLVGSNRAFAPVVRLGLQASDAVIMVSNWLAEETRRRFGLCASKPCRVIHNFVDGNRFKRPETPVCCRRSLAKPDQKIVVHLSNFRPVKRVNDVIRIFHRIVSEVPSVLLMVGDGPDRDAASTLVHELGIEKSVRFLGLQNDIVSLLSAADLFLFPSQYESFGLAVLEAMACETPVVCTSGGGLPEVMEDGATGYMCAVGDNDEMARRSVEILLDSAKARDMGRAGRARALEFFNPDRMLDAHEDLYETILSTPIASSS